MITKRSRYAGCQLLREPGQEYLSTRPPVVIPPLPDDRFHEVQLGERIDQIAFSYLGDAKLWWVIAEANDLAWAAELAPGTVLRVPPLAHVEMKVLG